jgi:hypothetical protein
MDHKKSIARALLLILTCSFIVFAAGCSESLFGRNSRLSGIVAFAEESEDTTAFLTKPGMGYAQTYIRFGDDLADDVIMFIDHELLEGVADPHWVPGGDWMALAGVQRTGVVWVAGGFSVSRNGEPSTQRNWSIHNLNQHLKPNVWYQIRVNADFATGRFISFSIKGEEIDQTIDLSDVLLDYPNYMPFDRSGMIYIVGAMRGRSMMNNEGTPIVFFDDVEGGIIKSNGKLKPLFFNDFESQLTINKQPLTPAPIKLDAYRLSHWYLEREESIFHIEKSPFARSGHSLGVANVQLHD